MLAQSFARQHAALLVRESWSQAFASIMDCAASIRNDAATALLGLGE